MELDLDRSGHIPEGLLALTFNGEQCEIGIQLNADEARKLKKFLAFIMD